MAFGTWIKNLMKGAKNLVGKVGNAIRNIAPKIQKGIEIGKRVADGAGEFASGIGGSAGEKIQKIADIARSGLDKAGQITGGVQRYLTGSGADRFSQLQLNNS